MVDERKLLPIVMPLMSTEKFSLDGYVAGNPAAEKERFHSAVVQVSELFKEVIDRLREQKLNDDAGNFEAYRILLEDPMLFYDAEDLIIAGKSAPQAVLDAYEKSATTFESMLDEYFFKRAKDFRLLGNFLAKFIAENF